MPRVKVEETTRMGIPKTTKRHKGRSGRRIYRTRMMEPENGRERERRGEKERLVGKASDEFTFCRTLIRGQLYRAGVCLHTMNRAFSIDVAGRLTPICCAFCIPLGFSARPLNKYGLRVPAHRRDVPARSIPSPAIKNGIK